MIVFRISEQAMEAQVSAGYYQPQQPYQSPQQPGPSAPMQMMPSGTQQQTIVIQQQPTTSGVILQNTREWTHGLCSCCSDLGECAYSSSHRHRFSPGFSYNE